MSSKSIPTNNIEKLRRARKMSMDALGTMIGTDASTINKIEKSKMKLDSVRLKKIADALEVDPGAILSDTAPEITNDSTPRSKHVERTEAQMMPIMGSAAGSIMRGVFQITSGPVDYIELPKALENASGIYALYINGTSMEPMFKHGSICVVSEYKPPRIGDVVILQEKKSELAQMEASIGILEARKSDKILIRKLNPLSPIEFNTEHIVSLHKVLSYDELLGI